MKRLNPSCDRRLEITVRDETLLIREKTGWQADPQLAELYEAIAKELYAGERIPTSIHLHFTCVTNGRNQSRPRCLIRKLTPLEMARAMLSQRSRNRSLKLDSLLASPSCRSARFDIGKTLIPRQECAADYPIRDGLPVMFVDSVERPVA